ncbi:Reverse transcriptase (RNA-dependent DNA polymerase), partial [Rhizoctonia solani]
LVHPTPTYYFVITRKAIFTGMDCNSGGAWRYYAPPDHAIWTLRNIYFPCSLPDPASSNAPPPLLSSNEPDSLSTDCWVQVFAPSEGEMGSSTANTSKTEHTPVKTEESTWPKHLPPSTNSSTQGEHSALPHAPPAPIPTTQTSPSHSDHLHRPATSTSTSPLPEDCSVPGHPPPTRYDNNSPKWSDALKSNRRKEWLAGLDTEFTILERQDVFDDFPHKLIPPGHQILSSGVVTKVKRDADGNKVCLKYPKGHGKGGPTVMKLKKALYGAHQSGHLWENYQNNKIIALGYRCCKKDVSIFVCTNKDSIYSIIICYVDDFVICCTRGHIDPIKKEILQLFDCKDLGETKLFLGIAITRDQPARKILLNMNAYINNIVARCCQPDIAFPTALLARFSSCYGAPHIAVICCIHRYLLETAHIGLTYDGNKPFYEVAYSDADFASQYGRKSITGSIVMMGGAAISWVSKRQPSVSLSTMEAEFIALCTTAKEIISVRQFLDDLGISHDTPTTSPIFCDNQAAIEAVHNPTHKTRAKHIDIAYNFIRDKIHQMKITVSFIPTRDNLADPFTKPLNYNQHWYLANSFLGIPSLHHANAFGNSFPRTLYALDQHELVASLPKM